MSSILKYRWFFLSIAVAAFIIMLSSISYQVSDNDSLDFSIKSISALLADPDFLIYLTVGFIAQMIDGSLGMAYGVSSTSFLMSAGVSPAIASSSVHVAEVFTTAVSGISHWKFGNVDKTLFKKLAIPGALGAALGAYFLSSFDGNVIKPYIALYLLIMGIIIIRKAFKKVILFKENKRLGALALFGGFVDATGGGGWGPVVTSTLMGSGNNPKLTIGTVNAVEFFVALAASGIFTIFVGINSWPVIIGLIIGGIIAAPIGAYITHKINPKIAMVIVGVVIILLSFRTILKALILT
jgi:uncharacterized membrane protein YfcA